MFVVSIFLLGKTEDFNFHVCTLLSCTIWAHSFMLILKLLINKTSPFIILDCSPITALILGSIFERIVSIKETNSPTLLNGSVTSRSSLYILKQVKDVEVRCFVQTLICVSYYYILHCLLYIKKYYYI